MIKNFASRFMNNLFVFFVVFVFAFGFVSGDFFFNDDDDESDVRDSELYGLDLVEWQHVGVLQPKFTDMLKEPRGGSGNPPHNFSHPGEPCDSDLYEKYLKDLQILESHAKINKKRLDKKVLERLVNDTTHYEMVVNNFLAMAEKDMFTFKQVCYHQRSPMYCNPKTLKCECLEIPEIGFYGYKLNQNEEYDINTWSHIKFCKLQEGYVCRFQKSDLQCLDGLVCNPLGLCQMDYTAGKLPPSRSSRKSRISFQSLVLIIMIIAGWLV